MSGQVPKTEKHLAVGVATDLDQVSVPLVTSLTSDWPFRLAGMVEPPPPVHGNSNRRSVSTLRPSAKDAYMLFQVWQQRGSSGLLNVAPRLQIKVAEF